jgi:hypothetical protein
MVVALLRVKRIVRRKPRVCVKHHKGKRLAVPTAGLFVE